jgi:hypothetical protein
MSKSKKFSEWGYEGYASGYMSSIKGLPTITMADLKVGGGVLKVDREYIQEKYGVLIDPTSYNEFLYGFKHGWNDKVKGRGFRDD